MYITVSLTSIQTPEFHILSNVTDNKWLMDYAVSYNITGDLNNLSIHLEYDATNKVMLSDGLSLTVSHMIFNSKITQKNFHSQRYTMCPKSLQKSYFYASLYITK